MDAASPRPRPVYFERHLPELASRWSPVGATWSGAVDGWFASYNGPSGLALLLSAGPTLPEGDVVETVPLGPYQGAISELATWRATWEADDATYSVSVIPAEGDVLTLAEFKAELADLTWP